MFSQHINAHASSNEALAQFYADRFRGEAKTAFKAWMTTQPFLACVPRGGGRGEGNTETTACFQNAT